MALTFETPLIVEDAQGNRFINPEKVGESFFSLNATDYPLSVPAGQTAYTTFQVPEDPGHAGDFEVAGLIGRAQAPFLFRMEEVGVDASSFMNVPIHHDLCIGAGGLPFVLKESALFLSGRTIRLGITNLSSTLTANFYVSAIGRRFTSEMKPADRACRRDFLDGRATRPYWLGLDNNNTGFVTLTAGVQNQPFYMTMPSGSHFLADEILFEAQDDAIGLQLFDGQTGRMLTYPGAIDLRTFGGTGRFPAQTLGSPVVQPRRSILAQFNENSGSTNKICFAFHGRRIRLPMGSD